jgi:hypothetical protein
MVTPSSTTAPTTTPATASIRVGVDGRQQAADARHPGHGVGRAFGQVVQRFEGMADDAAADHEHGHGADHRQRFHQEWRAASSILPIARTALPLLRLRYRPRSSILTMPATMP